MRLFLKLQVVMFVCYAMYSTIAPPKIYADVVLDLGPLFRDAFANGSATDAATGTTVSYSSNDSGGALIVNSPSSTSDFGSNSATGVIGDWGYGVWDVTFGNSFGPNGNSNLISAADFSLDQSSLNGSSNWYEWGMIDLNGGSNITTAQLEAYLNDVTNYDDINDTNIGTALGADAANDSFNMFGPSVAGGSDDDMGVFVNGSPDNDGVDNSNTTWDNSEFGLASDAGISGFSFYYGYSLSNTESQTSNPRGSIRELTDTQQAQGVPEPSSASILALATIALCNRRRRK